MQCVRDWRLLCQRQARKRSHWRCWRRQWMQLWKLKGPRRQSICACCWHKCTLCRLVLFALNFFDAWSHCFQPLFLICLLSSSRHHDCVLLLLQGMLQKLRRQIFVELFAQKFGQIVPIFYLLNPLSGGAEVSGKWLQLSLACMMKAMFWYLVSNTHKVSDYYAQFLSCLFWFFWNSQNGYL